MSSSLDPDLAGRFVGPDLDPNCLRRISANDMSRQRVESNSHVCQPLMHRSQLKLSAFLLCFKLLKIVQHQHECLHLIIL